MKHMAGTQRHQPAGGHEQEGGIAIVGCIVFFFSLKASTQLYFLLWNLFGLAIYLLWSSRNARLAKTPEA